jgi:hypothetical protein
MAQIVSSEIYEKKLQEWKEMTGNKIKSDRVYYEKVIKELAETLKKKEDIKLYKEYKAEVKRLMSIKL